MWCAGQQREVCHLFGYKDNKPVSEDLASRYSNGHNDLADFRDRENMRRALKGGGKARSVFCVPPPVPATAFAVVAVTLWLHFFADYSVAVRVLSCAFLRPVEEIDDPPAPT